MAHDSWGPGWPDCPAGSIVAIDVDGTRFPGGVRAELAELIGRLVAECKRRGYTFGTADDPSYGCWGYSCRCIAGTSSPSNHSCGLAVDCNAPWNPQADPLQTDMPEWMPDVWAAYGFRWGGDYTGTPDPMHYEYMGSMADAEADTQRAIEERLGEESVYLVHTYVDATPDGAVVKFMGADVQYDRITGAWCSDPARATTWHMIRGMDPTVAVVYADPPARVDVAFL